MPRPPGEPRLSKEQPVPGCRHDPAVIAVFEITKVTGRSRSEQRARFSTIFGRCRRALVALLPVCRIGCGQPATRLAEPFFVGPTNNQQYLQQRFRLRRPNSRQYLLTCCATGELFEKKEGSSIATCQRPLQSNQRDLYCFAQNDIEK